MGLFDNKSVLDKTIKKLQSEVEFDFSKIDLTKYLEAYNDELLVSKILTKIANYEKQSSTSFEMELNQITKIYKTIVRIPDSLEQRNIFLELVNIYFENEWFFGENDNLSTVSNAFDDKMIVLEFIRFFINNKNILSSSNENISILMGYLQEARQYFVDDRALFSSAISLINNMDPAILNHGKTNSIKKVINEKLEQDRKASGIYNIDQATLQEMERKLEETGLLSERLSTLVQAADKQIEELNESLKNHKSELTELRIKELKSLKEEANNILKNFNASYLELLKQEKESIINERDLLMADIDRELSEKKVQLASYAEGIAQKVNLELRRIRNVSSESIQQMETFLSSNENVKKMLSEAKTNEEFLKRLSEIEGIATKMGASSSVVTQTGSSPLGQLYIPTIILPGEDTQNSAPINHYFDKRIPFKDRFNELMELKQMYIEEEDAIYHKQFDDILTMIIQNDAPYMYGPSGCGKTYMIEEQIAKLLDIDVVTNGYVLYEQDILGYTNSGTGGYVPSNFYRCYKVGNIIFFDELDNGIANATTVLNSFLTGSASKKYVFPNGEEVKGHPNFRIITAGNTKGTGKTLAHNTRQKMDESVMQRLTPVPVTYDNRIEKKILVNYPGWYDFAVNFRKAIEEIPSQSGDDINTIGTFTTRDAESVRKYKDDDAMTDEQLLEYEIIENKDMDYLMQIKKKMSNYEQNGEFETEEGRKLLKTFVSKVESRSKQ